MFLHKAGKMKAEVTEDLELKINWRHKKNSKAFNERLIEGARLSRWHQLNRADRGNSFFILKESLPFIISRFDFQEFFFSTEWNPASVEKITYGTLALIAGTILVTSISMLIAVPLGLACAFYISEFCSPQLKEIYKVLIEFLAAIPSVVWGFIAIMMINPP